MTSAKVERVPGKVFRVCSEHNPKSKPEKYKRVHYLVSRLGLVISDRLQEGLLGLRSSAHQAPDPELQQLALKGYSDAEFTGAAKEILCIWLHQEAIDQGGRGAPSWLLSFLRLALSASDFLIPSPRAMDIFASYDQCEDMRSLCREAAIRTCQVLGFGEQAPLFASAVVGLLVHSRVERQEVLEDSLCLPIDVVESWRAG